MSSTKHLHYKAKKYGLELTDFLVGCVIMLVLESLNKDFSTIFMVVVAYLVGKYVFAPWLPKGWFVFLAQKRKYVRWPYQIKEYGHV